MQQQQGGKSDDQPDGKILVEFLHARLLGNEQDDGKNAPKVDDGAGGRPKATAAQASGMSDQGYHKSR